MFSSHFRELLMYVAEKPLHWSQPREPPAHSHLTMTLDFYTVEG